MTIFTSRLVFFIGKKGRFPMFALFKFVHYHLMGKIFIRRGVLYMTLCSAIYFFSRFVWYLLQIQMTMTAQNIIMNSIGVKRFIYIKNLFGARIFIKTAQSGIAMTQHTIFLICSSDHYGVPCTFNEQHETKNK